MDLSIQKIYHSPQSQSCETIFGSLAFAIVAYLGSKGDLKPNISMLKSCQIADLQKYAVKCKKHAGRPKGVRVEIGPVVKQSARRNTVRRKRWVFHDRALLDLESTGTTDCRLKLLQRRDCEHTHHHHTPAFLCVAGRQSSLDHLAGEMPSQFLSKQTSFQTASGTPIFAIQLPNRVMDFTSDVNRPWKAWDILCRWVSKSASENRNPAARKTFLFSFLLTTHFFPFTISQKLRTQKVHGNLSGQQPAHTTQSKTSNQ